MSVDLLHRLRLVLAEETNGRDGVSPPVRPVAGNHRGRSHTVRRIIKTANNGRKRFKELTRPRWRPPARGRPHSAPPPRFYPAPGGGQSSDLRFGFTRSGSENDEVSYQVVDDVEAVILAVVGVDAAVCLLPHVVLQRCFVPEGFLAVQTLQTERKSH